MHELSPVDKIWNRACKGGGESPHAGDKALAALLLFHGLAMNGGVLHAVECLSVKQLREAMNGYKYFGFKPVADLICSAQNAIEKGLDLDVLESTMNDQYWSQVPNDEILVNSFENHQKQNPSEYSPIIEGE